MPLRNLEYFTSFLPQINIGSLKEKLFFSLDTQSVWLFLNNSFLIYYFTVYLNIKNKHVDLQDLLSF